MIDYIRDTPCAPRPPALKQGLRFPDELDSNLWRQWPPNHPPEHSITSPEASGSAETGQSISSSKNPSHVDPGNFLVVDWYGADDPEVRIHAQESIYKETNKILNREPSELAAVPKASGNWPDMRPQLCSL